MIMKQELMRLKMLEVLFQQKLMFLFFDDEVEEGHELMFHEIDEVEEVEHDD